MEVIVNLNEKTEKTSKQTSKNQISKQKQFNMENSLPHTTVVLWVQWDEVKTDQN